MEVSDTTLLLEMHKDLKLTLVEHGKKIDKVMELSITNHHDLEAAKKDILSIQTEQKSFIKKPKTGTFSFWVKVGTLLSAIIVGVYQYFTNQG